MNETKADVLTDRTISIKIEPDVHARLKLLSKEEGLSMGAILDHFCRAMFEYCDDGEDPEFRSEFFKHVRGLDM